MSCHSTRGIEFQGETRSYREWAEVTGIPFTTLHRRIKDGWSTQDALTVAPGEGRGDCLWMAVSVDDYQLPEAVAASVRELAEMLGIKSETIYNRLSRQRKGTCKEKYIRVVLDEEE